MDSGKNTESSPEPQAPSSADRRDETASEETAEHSAELERLVAKDQAGETAPEQGSAGSSQPQGYALPDGENEKRSAGKTEPSAAQIKANRENARKSTGPRSMAGKLRASANALKTGRFRGRNGSYIGMFHARMIELREDPDEFAKLEQGLRHSFTPTNEAQELLVHGIAQLYWQRERLDRAQSGVMSCRMRKLQIERERESLQVSQKMSADLKIAELKAGLVWARETPTKFQKMLEGLETLQHCLERADYATAEAVMSWLYGKSPTVRGALIRDMFKNLAKDACPEQPSQPPLDGPAFSGGFQEQKTPEPPPDPFTVSMLKLELEKEVTNVAAQYDLYLREHTELTATMLDACLAPTKKHRWLIQQMNFIDRQIIQKTTLLLNMQKADDARRKHDKQSDEEEKPEISNLQILPDSQTTKQ